MSKKETTKSPRSIELKLLVPYSIILVLAVSAAAFAGGFHTHQQVQNDVDSRAKAYASTMVAELKENQ